MLSMGMHYPQDVSGRAHHPKPTPHHHNDPNLPVCLPRGLSLSEIQALNTADGSRPDDLDQVDIVNIAPLGARHASRVLAPLRMPAAGAIHFQDVRGPNHCHSSPRLSSGVSQRSADHLLGGAANFRRAGEQRVNLQHVPTRGECTRGRAQGGVFSDAGGVGGRPASGCTCMRNRNRISASSHRCSADRRQAASSSARSRDSALPQDVPQDIQELLSVDQKTLHTRRGISREREEPHRPLPEPADDPYYPVNYSYGFDASYNSYEESSPYSQIQSSGRSSPTRTEGARSWVAFSNGWTTGNTTERSSIYSLGEDEFDRKASQRVRQLFEQIDHMLFEDRPGPGHLYTECDQWVGRFPHLRILGDQLLPPQDLGFQIVSGSPRAEQHADNLLCDITDNDITASQGLNELSVSGQHVAARVPPVESLAQLSDGAHTGYEKEEVFAEDGYIEDIIAVDYKTADEDVLDKARQYRNMARRRQSGMPPMTPQACVKDNIGSTTFDVMWAEVISWLRDVMQKYGHAIYIAAVSEGATEGDEKRSLALTLPDRARAQRDILPPSRETSLLNSSRLDSRVTRLPMSAASQSPEGRGLDGLLTISTKALQSRDRNSLVEQMTPDGLVVSAMPLAIVGARPGSSTARYIMRPGSVKPQDSRLMSARLRTAPGRGRLAPLERAKTPSNDDDRQMLQNEVLRGHRLTTLNDSLFSPTPPLSFHRNSALPPISLDQQDHGLKNIDEIDSELDSKIHLTGRASSAVNDKDGRSVYKDRDRERIAMTLDARPSTTHAMYRSDTPFSNRQTTTPLGFSSNRMAALSGLGKVIGGSNTNVLHLDVRGSGINPHVEPGGGELDGEHIDEMIHSQWDPNRGRLIHSGVFRNFEAGPAHVPPQLRRTKQQYNMGSVR